MDVKRFRKAFWTHFNGSQRNEPHQELWVPEFSRSLDLCPDVEGKLSLKKQQLLNLAYHLLPPGEAYLEIGTYHGKSLISAMIGNPPRPTFACDNFSQFDVNSYDILSANLRRHDLFEAVTFYDCDFLDIFTPERLPAPIGLYFYDGAHDEESQYRAIKEVEPFLADEALVLVDDWRFAPDSQSYAQAGTLRAVGDSTHAWQLLYDLPARCNGDLAMWWNGVGVLAFQRVADEVTQAESAAV
ncbi:MAG: class I SAM-dependent methyltransferase [Candidatus Hydrogenedentes bacterium]|nr:class I SAM-dependent methyltransferase [Candidatus Hydrogenedentota bacterium]